MMRINSSVTTDYEYRIYIILYKLIIAVYTYVHTHMAMDDMFLGYPIGHGYTIPKYHSKRNSNVTVSYMFLY